MLRRGAQVWRKLRSGGASQLWSGARRTLSESAHPPGKGGESSTASTLFENVRLPPEGPGASASGGWEAAAAAEAPTAAGRTFSAIGNALFFGSLAVGGYFGYYTYLYDADQLQHMVDETAKAENAFPGSEAWVSVMNAYLDKRHQVEAEFKKYADPPSDKLLPDLPPHARHVKTLVLDLDDVLVHSDWSRARGWRTFKRPGAEDFIKDLSQYYELVVYTSQLPTYADPILDRLDPQRLIQYRLYRDSTQYVNGKHVRDLSKLNRDPHQVLFLTADKDAYALQPENAVKLHPWKLETGDTGLLDLLPFLEAIVRTNVTDVREVVKSYDGQDIPAAFRERMKRVQEQQAARQQRGRGLFARGG